MAKLRLQKAAEIALTDYMGLAAEETLLVVSDKNMRDIGIALFEAGESICEEAFYAEISPRQNNGQEPPEPIAELMKQVDVVICPTTKSLTHTDARRSASRLGVRIGTMPGITANTMARCLNADFEKIQTMSANLAEYLKNASKIRVKTKSGTDVTFEMRKRRIIQSTGVLRNIGESGNLPSGEVFMAPWEGKTNGVIVFDGSFAGIGILENPVTVEVKDGFAEKISGKDEAKKLTKMLSEHGKYGRAIAEFGIGTNYKAKISGEILEDEKALGTVHFAFGNNLSMGGKINVPIHIDGVIRDPDVFVDNEQIMKNGKLTIEV
ncbi:MAG: aminopeptidase [Candidatus Kapaibacterium sp.]